MLEVPLSQEMIPAKRETMIRPIIAKIQSSKTKIRIIREAKHSKTKRSTVPLTDFSKRTLERGASHIPEMLEEARKQEKVAYMMDRLIITNIRDKQPGKDVG